MDGLKTSVLLLSMIFLLPGVYGLDFSMGASNGMKGGSEALSLNAGLDSSVASSTSFCPEDYSSSMKFEGTDDFEFNETFNSLDGGEHVRLIAKTSNSNSYTHIHEIEKQNNKRIKVSQSFVVDQGECIETSAQAWNSMGQSANVGLKIPSGSLIYESYGEATDDNAIADQNAFIPESTQFNTFAEATQDIYTKKSKNSMKSSKPLTAMTTASSMSENTKISNKISRDTMSKNSIIK